jgi:hypothetical protein
MNIETFETKFTIALDGCWLWVEHVDKDGYGKVRVGKDKLRAHRVSYELYREQIPAGMVIDHLCLQKSCVNPHHLDVVTLAENNKRRPYTKLCEHGTGVTRCELGCAKEYLREYQREYIKNNRESVNRKARESYARRKVV